MLASSLCDVPGVSELMCSLVTIQRIAFVSSFYVQKDNIFFTIFFKWSLKGVLREILFLEC